MASVPSHRSPIGRYTTRGYPTGDYPTRDYPTGYPIVGYCTGGHPTDGCRPGVSQNTYLGRYSGRVADTRANLVFHVVVRRVVDHEDNELPWLCLPRANHASDVLAGIAIAPRHLHHTRESGSGR